MSVNLLLFLIITLLNSCPSLKELSINECMATEYGLKEAFLLLNVHRLDLRMNELTNKYKKYCFDFLVLSPNDYLKNLQCARFIFHASLIHVSFLYLCRINITKKSLLLTERKKSQNNEQFWFF